MDLMQLLSWACIVFTVGMFSTGLNLGWLYYGLLKKDQTIVFVNVIGALLQILYIIVYLHYTTQKRLVTSQTVAAGTVLAMYLSPLTDLVGIVRSGDVQRLSFPLTVATFFTSTSWVLYGLQLHDQYIWVPNTPGIFTSLIRLYLFWRFAAVKQSSPAYRSM
ncbi:Sugar transporter SWEET1 [Dissostichus eleginoides]|uniref:Sugar transporter SWEET1 n=1 Tax=Dissostichus eleginoides TaxID=100907 RepID=A0AAD9C4T7_DISEL|nr:Sugar transporter SWEET1 [Dissostichus eleginoides]